MKQQFKTALAIALMLCTMSLVSCDIFDVKADVDADVDIEALAGELAGLEQPVNVETGAPAAITDEAVSDAVAEPDEKSVNEAGSPVTYQSTSQKFKASAAFDTQILLNPSTDVIYPGSVLLGHTIDDGSYVEVTKGTKREVTISYDLTGIVDGKVSGKIVPSLSNYREFHNEILSQEIPAQSSIYTYESIEIDDESEMDIKLTAGAKYAAPTVQASIKAGFSYSKSNKNHKYMVKFMQTFYTVDIDQGDGTFLYNDFNVEDFGGYRPVYVASVAYGRLAYLTIESSKSWEEIKASLDVVVNTASYGDYDVDFDMAMEKLKTETKLNITVIGGSTVATDIEGFNEFLKEGGFSSTNSGKIVSYKLRFVDDNTVANTIFNGEYTVRSTTVVDGKGIKVGVRLASIADQFDDGDSQSEFYGSIVYTAGSDTFTLWSRGESNAWAIGKGSTQTLAEGGEFAFQYHTFANGTEQLTINTSGEFGEYDLTGNNEVCTTTPITKKVSELNNGDTLKLRLTNSSDGSVEYTFVVYKELLY